MVDRFARRWAAALTGDDRVDGSASAVAELRPLVVRPARVVAADRADDALAHDVCAVLAGVGRMAGVVPALLTLLDGLGVTVDVAAGHLRDPELPAQVAAILGDTGLPPELLHLELAESAVIGAGPGPVDALVGLAGAGVRLVVDGFGTGYSHLAHLARLPVSELKTPRRSSPTCRCTTGSARDHLAGPRDGADGDRRGRGEPRAGRAAARAALRRRPGPVVRGADVGRRGHPAAGGAADARGRRGWAAPRGVADPAVRSSPEGAGA